MKLEKMVFLSLQKLFSFSRKSNFSFKVIQILWRHQIPKQTQSFNDIWPIYVILQKNKNYQKVFAKTVT